MLLDHQPTINPSNKMTHGFNSALEDLGLLNTLRPSLVPSIRAQGLHVCLNAAQALSKRPCDALTVPLQQHWDLGGARRGTSYSFLLLFATSGCLANMFIWNNVYWVGLQKTPTQNTSRRV
jgi:hypothetical protein